MATAQVELPPVLVDFSEIDNPPDEDLEEWKNALLAGTGQQFEEDEDGVLTLVETGAGLGPRDAPEAANDGVIVDFPDELQASEEGGVLAEEGLLEEEPGLLEKAGGLWSWLQGDTAGEVAAEPEPAPAPVKKAKAKPISKPKAKPVKRQPAKRVPSNRRKKNEPPSDPEAIAKDKAIRKYLAYARRFNLEGDSMTKSVAQLKKLSIEDINTHYQLMKDRANEGENEAVLYDFIIEGLGLFARLYQAKLRRTKIAAQMYGNVSMCELQRVFKEKTSDDPDLEDTTLKADIAEAAIELADWLHRPWWLRLGFHAHRLLEEAARRESEARAAVHLGKPTSDRSQRVMERLGVI